ncbi:MAG: glycosyltransferase [Bacteroidales bacterium]
MNFQLYQISPFWVIVAGFFLLSFLIQMFYYLFFFIRISLKKKNDRIEGSGEPVSVIICARNEAVNLENNLPLILQQEYSDYEVIVVNDCSEDNTEEVLDELKKKFSNLRSTFIRQDKKFRSGKKLALTIGLKSACHPWALLTDADCIPASKHWISEMQKHFTPSNKIVLGYGGYIMRPGLLDKFVRFDTFFIAMQYISFALAGMPYMGVGRNLAYKRSLFFDNKGFASHLNLESGDDDLFINEVISKDNNSVEYSHSSHTRSKPPQSWKEWFIQKSRHLTTGIHYKGSTRFLLGLEMSSRLFFYITFFLLVINKIYLPYILSVFIIRLISNTLILNKGMNCMNEKNLLLFSPVFDLIIILFNIFCVTRNFMTLKRSRWR